MSLTYRPNGLDARGYVTRWAVMSPPDMYGFPRLLAMVEPENAARALCGMPEIEDGWKAYPERLVRAPADDLNPVNRESTDGYEIGWSIPLVAKLKPAADTYSRTAKTVRVAAEKWLGAPATALGNAGHPYWTSHATPSEAASSPADDPSPPRTLVEDLLAASALLARLAGRMRRECTTVF